MNGEAVEQPQRRYEVCAIHNNKYGFRGVDWDGSRRMFRARAEPTPGKRGRFLGRFGTAKLAALAYDEEARRVYGAEARLNFPGPGEKPTLPSKRPAGRCPKDHDLGVEGYTHGRGVSCRACNREASARYYARKRARKSAGEL